MKLKDILTNCNLLEIVGEKDVDVVDITFDSRKVSQGTLFFAVKGTQVDGHDYIDGAIEKGASVIVCEKLPRKKAENVTYVKVDNSAYVLGVGASNFFGNPSEKLKLVGVTGTNGKTTIATLLYRLFTEAGYNCGLLSTIENIINREVIPSTHTTPDPIELNTLLQQMVERECEYVFMEVSSHSVAQDRIAGLHFAGGIFTNLTHDHLDYHKTMANYRNAKKKFFDGLPQSAFALTNLDDKNGAFMLQNTASNLLAIYGAATALGFNKDELLVEISKLRGANGRFDMVHSEQGIVGIVDYAHTPDALENVLVTINEVRCHKETLITVVGCGGNRDTTKRPEMAAVAVKLSDRVILTSDNPRNEDPDEIIRQMKAGVAEEDRGKVLSITNRREAIRTAVALAKRGDIGVKNHFDDKEVLSEALKEA